MDDESFLRRWSRLKTQPAPEPVAIVSAPLEVAAPEIAAEPAVEPAVESLLPTLEDAAALTADSDFSTFVARNVDAAVRRLAMKKLFADPHFHGHDGLDIYMGDFNLPSPVPASMLEQLSHTKKLFAALGDALAPEEEVPEQALESAPPAPAEAPPISPDQEAA
ncbi:MAG: DUF3306 domain-containing protein [Massilia sp.]